MKIQLPKGDSFAMRSLYSRGAPKQLAVIEPFYLDERVRTFVADSETGLMPKKITKKSQLDDYATVLAAPTKHPYVYCIGSEPSDKRAKLLAATIAIKYLEENKQGSRGLIWHILTGSYKDTLRDNILKGDRKPNLLILTNITAESTEVKLEKLRDILELYSDIPRIVLLTGENPLTFFNDYIRYQLNYLTLINSSRKKTLSGAVD